jgi:hypothetical protein
MMASRFVLSVLSHNPKHAIPASVRIKHVIAMRGMEQNFGAWQAMRD